LQSILQEEAIGSAPQLPREPRRRNRPCDVWLWGLYKHIELSAPLICIYKASLSGILSLKQIVVKGMLSCELPLFSLTGSSCK
jgi:hypothetical protein